MVARRPGVLHLFFMHRRSLSVHLPDLHAPCHSSRKANVHVMNDREHGPREETAPYQRYVGNCRHCVSTNAEQSIRPFYLFA
jgi:hypothetical protein